MKKAIKHIERLQYRIDNRDKIIKEEIARNIYLLTALRFSQESDRKELATLEYLDAGNEN